MLRESRQKRPIRAPPEGLRNIIRCATFYRQSEMLKRQGITIDRSTLSVWLVRTCWWLRPLYDLTLSTVVSAPVVFADDTTLPVLDPGRGKTKDRTVVVLRGRSADLEKARGIRAAAYIHSPDPQGRSIPPNASRRLPRQAAGRWLHRVPRPGETRHDRAGFLLGPLQASLLRLPRSDQIAARR